MLFYTSALVCSSMANFSEHQEIRRNVKGRFKTFG
jgi:hypothetical protein